MIITIITNITITITTIMIIIITITITITHIIISLFESYHANHNTLGAGSASAAGAAS